MNRRIPVWCIPLVSVLWFCIAGLILMPYPGLQHDELFFSGPLYYADAAFFSVQAGATKIPFMVISYTGALKTWLYAGLFEFFEPSLWSVRVPVLLMGMASIWLTWAWVRRIAGTRAAAVTTVLLATDAIYLATDIFDWGPVALQHLLLMAGLLPIQRWLETGSRKFLALGFFFLGLGMWDKALLSWPLIGMSVALLCVFPRYLFLRLRLLPIVIALISFLAGAAPFVWFNIARHGETASTNARFNASEIGPKLSALRQTVDGSTLQGYMVYKTPGPSPRAPGIAIEKTSVWIAAHFGNHRRNYMLAGYALALICFVAAFRTRAWKLLLFLLITVIVEWLQMALNQGTGSAAHHVILMWPFTVALLGIAFAAASRRIPRYGVPVLAGVTAILLAGNVLNTNEYLAEFTVNGAMGGWTDAVYALSDTVQKSSGSWIGLVDWGFLNPLRMLHEGELPLFLAPVPAAGEAATDASRAELRRVIGDPTRLFIQHTDDKQMFAGVNGRFRKAAADIGYEEKVQEVIPDRNGRPVIELFRFQPRATVNPLP